MPKYLLQVSYTQEGLDGLVKEGGTARKAAVVKAFEALGGTLEAYYYAFGYTDVFVIVDLPDNMTAVAASMMANTPGTAKVTYTVLVTPEEVDQAAQLAQKMSASYRPPGR